MTPLDLPIPTERLRLEPLAPAHVPGLFAALRDPKTYTWLSGAPPANEAAVADRVARLATRRREDHPTLWLAWAAIRRLDGVCIGSLDVDLTGTVATNVGYLFHPDAWGRRYGTEAVAALVAHLEGHGTTGFVATVTVGNIASAKVLEAAGFVRTRILPDNDTIRGVPHDDWEYVRH